MQFKLFTVQKYAERQGVSRQTVYNWLRDGKLETVEISGHRFIRA